MSIAWTLFAFFFMVFAALPWINLTRGIGPHPVMTLLFLIGWSALPVLFGCWLLFNAWCRIELSGASGLIHRSSRWLFLWFERAYPFERACLVRQWQFSKHGSIARNVLFVRTGNRSRRLADELICRDLPAMLDWISYATGVKVVDARHRAPVGA